MPNDAVDDEETFHGDAPDRVATVRLPALAVGDAVTALRLTVEDKRTEAPKPFTDASLIAAMCGVAKFVRSPTVKKILTEADGIGTPATRAAIIETLFERGYAERVRRTIVSTETGRALVGNLPEVATTPDMTAVWEAAMRAVCERHADARRLRRARRRAARAARHRRPRARPHRRSPAPRAGSRAGSTHGPETSKERRQTTASHNQKAEDIMLKTFPVPPGATRPADTLASMAVTLVTCAHPASSHVWIPASGATWCSSCGALRCRSRGRSGRLAGGRGSLASHQEALRGDRPRSFTASAS